MCIVSSNIYKLCLIPLKFCNYFMKIGVFPEFCIISVSSIKYNLYFNKCTFYVSSQHQKICFITTPKKCIIPLKVNQTNVPTMLDHNTKKKMYFPLKVNQLSTILSKPLSKKVKIAKMWEKNVITLPISTITFFLNFVQQFK